MRVVVENIPDAGQVVRVQADQAWATDAAARALEEHPAPEGAAVVDALSGELELKKRGREVDVAGAVTMRTRRTCERCGEEVEVAVDAEADLVYVPVATRGEDDASHPEVELESEDLDVGWYEGEEIAMDDVLCEVLSLALPTRITCADVAACDARTERLLSQHGSAGEKGGHPGFSKLKKV